jgi:phosphoglycolate phosphatase-like HAD superfamily hydrolase
VPPADRIATFDNDGTLWCEKPRYVQAEMIFRRWQAMVVAHPAKAEHQPYKAVAENDLAWFASVTETSTDLLKGLAEAYDGYTVGAFEHAVQEFFATVTHPTLGKPYTDLGYRPMRELLDLLDANDFLVFICSGGGRDFIRPVAQQMYGIPRERVIGTAAAVQYRDGDLYHTRNLEQPVDDGAGKPEHIWMRTGRTPLLAGGNADGDVPMLSTARFVLLIRHDDVDREFAYDNGAEKAQAEAAERGWTVVSMNDDFADVFDSRITPKPRQPGPSMSLRSTRRGAPESTDQRTTPPTSARAAP